MIKPLNPPPHPHRHVIRIPVCMSIKILTAFYIYPVGPQSANNEEMSQEVTQ